MAMSPREAAAIRERARGYGLCAPERYWNEHAAVLARIAGGCGPGGKGDYLVPDTIYGLSMLPSCHIHDAGYAYGLTDEEKEVADRTFKNNNVRIIDAAYNESHWMPKIARRMLRNQRRLRAYLYYQSVNQCGGPSFWEGKNKPAALGHAATEPEREFEP